MRNKIVGILLSLVVALGFATTSASAEPVTKSPKVKYQQQFHVGEKPLKTWKDKDTGVVVEMFESFPESTGSVMALSAGWDLVGTDYWTMNGNDQFYWDAMFESTGGDYMFRVPAHSSTWNFAQSFVNLYENDGAGANTKVAQWTVEPQSVSYDYIVRDIGGYVDGSNARAEFHTYHQSGYPVSGGVLYNVGYYD